METEARFNRFKDVEWFPKQETTVLIGGAGGIGSWLTLLLTRAGFFPAVYDFDVYETHNMAGQLCKASDNGKFKVEALAHTVAEFCDGFQIYTLNEMYTDKSMTDKFVFAGFDNMAGRSVLFEKWKSKYGQDPTAIFIDGRLSLEQIQIFCVIGGTESVEKYKEHLFDDSEVAEASCTLKQTSHTAAIIAGYMTAFFTNHFSNVQSGDNSRAIPFKWEAFLPINFVMTD